MLIAHDLGTSGQQGVPCTTTTGGCWSRPARHTPPA